MSELQLGSLFIAAEHRYCLFKADAPSCCHSRHCVTLALLGDHAVAAWVHLMALWLCVSGRLLCLLSYFRQKLSHSLPSGSRLYKLDRVE